VRQAQQGVVAPNTQLTVEQYLTSWLEEVARRTVRPRTYQNYELMVRRHIVPAIGRVRLNRLAAADVRRLLNRASDRDYSPSTVRHIHAVLRVALEQAVRDDLLPRNVARLVQGPPPGTSVMGHRPQRVRPGPAGDERKVRVNKRITQRVAALAHRRRRPHQARDERHRRTFPPADERYADTRWIMRVLGVWGQGVGHGSQRRG
jgi:hypothetical protein